MSDPVVSVVIPTYNRLMFLRKAIASVRSQTYVNWELVVVDDGSTDDTVNYIRKVDESRLLLVRSEHLGIIGAVRNLGVSQARGTLVAFLDSDDTWKSEKLEHQLAAIKDSGAKWSYTGYEVVYPSSEVKPILPRLDEGMDKDTLIRRLLTTEASAATSTLLVSKHLFHDVGGFSEDESLLFREDHDLVLRLAGREAAATVRKSLAAVCEHPDRSTKHVSDPFLRSARVYERFLERSPDSRARRIAKTMWTRHMIWSANLDTDNGRSSAARQKLFGCASSGIRTLRWWKAVLFWVVKSRLSVPQRRRM
jgi:glycosyltransferase involved in cell wall biosynthesis